MHKILMAERSDLYHDARVQKEASSLRTAGYDVTVIGLRAKRVSIDKEFSFNMDTQYVLDRNWKQIRKLHLAILVLYLNIKILFMRSHYYHAHNTYFLPGMFLAKLLYKGKLVYDSHEVQWELNKTAMLLERIFISKVDKIINVSDGRARAQAHRFGLPLEKICIVSNYPVLENKIINLKTEKNDKNVRFIFSGGLNLSDNKIDNFIRAIKDYPEISLDLLAFGYSNSVPKIKNLATELGIGKRVRFIPLVKPNEVLETISKYDYTVNLIINPNNLISINYHSINKIYEGISAGLPILCSNLPAFREELVDNGIGFSVDPCSVASIREGIQLLIRNKENHPRMRAKAFELAVNKFNWANEEAKLLNLYTNL